MSMKMCYICNKKSVIQDFVYENGKFVLKERCCNPYCKKYNPYTYRFDKYKIL